MRGQAGERREGGDRDGAIAGCTTRVAYVRGECVRRYRATTSVGGHDVSDTIYAYFPWVLVSAREPEQRQYFCSLGHQSHTSPKRVTYREAQRGL